MTKYVFMIITIIIRIIVRIIIMIITIIIRRIIIEVGDFGDNGRDGGVFG